MAASNSPNSGSQRKVNVKVTAEIQEALRNLSQLERQVNKIGDLADQGERQQKGFLSPKQVAMYRKILAEIEKTYDKHYDNLGRMSQDYHAKQQKAVADLARRQQALNRAQGGNKWGDVASPRIVEYHERKLKEAQGNVDTLRPLKAELDRMAEIMRQIEGERNRGGTHADRVNNLHELDPYTKHQMQAMVNVAGSTGIISSIGALVNYLGTGKDLVRDREARVRDITQRGAYDGSDESNISRLEKVGREYGYNSSDTVALQSLLMQGGTGDRAKSLQDVESGQQFGRAFGVGSDALAPGFNMFRQMGTMEEGDMKHFAELIAGAISATNMDGRQEEMIRSTTLLASSVSQGLVKMSEQQFGNIASLQAAIGSATPELRGDRGAAMLTNLDQGIKGADHNLELLMGKGTEFTGIEGYYQLQLLKEEGLSNPDNLKRILQNTDKGLGTREMRNLALRNFGLSLHQIEELEKNGTFDKIKNGEMEFTPDMLENLGTQKLSEQTDSYKDSETATRQVNDAAQEIRQRNVADEYEATGSWVMDKFNSMPDWAQKTAVFGGALGGMLFGGKIIRGAGSLLQKGYKAIRPTIGAAGAAGGAAGAGGGIAGWWNRLRGGGGGTPPTGTPPVPPTGGTPPTGGARPPVILGPNGQPLPPSTPPVPPTPPAPPKGGFWNSLGKGGKNLLKGGGKVLGPVGQVMTFDFVDKIGYDFADWFWGHREGDKYNTPGLFDNPFAQQEVHKETKSWVGKRLWDDVSDRFSKEGRKEAADDLAVRNYKFNHPESASKSNEEILQLSKDESVRKQEEFRKMLDPNGDAARFGEMLKAHAKQPTPAPVIPSLTNTPDILSLGKGPLTKEAALKEMGFQQPNWLVDFSDAIENWEKSLDKKATITQEHTVKVVIDGKIDGMTPENQNEVKDAMIPFFQNGQYNPFNLNLMFDQKRR